MLALLERCVTDLSGTWAFATPTPWPSWPPKVGVSSHARVDRSDRGRHGRRTARFSDDQVETIRQRFASLNPYDPAAVPQILKRETPIRSPAWPSRQNVMPSTTSTTQGNWSSSTTTHPPNMAWGTSSTRQTQTPRTRSGSTPYGG